MDREMRFRKAQGQIVDRMAQLKLEQVTEAPTAADLRNTEDLENETRKALGGDVDSLPFLVSPESRKRRRVRDPLSQTDGHPGTDDAGQNDKYGSLVRQGWWTRSTPDIPMADRPGLEAGYQRDFATACSSQKVFRGLSRSSSLAYLKF